MSELEEREDVDAELLEAEDVLDIDENAEALDEVVPLTYFGTDFDVHGLVRRLNENEIVIPSFDPATDTGSDVEGFQRRFVWKKYQMDRFIESLLLGYPVPGIFLVQQPNKQLLVLDGQQRLRTLQQFYSGNLYKGTAFRLEHVSEELRGLGYRDLSPVDRRTLDNTFIHAIVVKYDPDAGGVLNVYQLFERLNTGGTNLYPQEIRVALYHGELVKLIRELNEDADWKLLYGKRSDRLKDQELILRFLAFYFEGEDYRRPLKGFLNRFLDDHQHLEGIDPERVKHVFAQTCSLIARAVGPRAFRVTAQVNAALVDSVMYGVARRLDRGPIENTEELGKAYERLVSDPEFVAAIGRATADEDRVRLRLTKAAEAFDAVP
jgi:hypothetical protein